MLPQTVMCMETPCARLSILRSIAAPIISCCCNTWNGNRRLRLCHIGARVYLTLPSLDAAVSTISFSPNGTAIPPATGRRVPGDGDVARLYQPLAPCYPEASGAAQT